LLSGLLGACGRVLEYPEPVAESSDALCHDGEDNDWDGKTDCEDDDCNGSCSEATLDECSDQRDNDGDGLTDTGDPRCWLYFPPQAERCAEARGTTIQENFDRPSWDVRWSSWQRWGRDRDGFVLRESSHEGQRQDLLLAFANNTTGSDELAANLGALVRHRPFSGSWEGFELEFSAAVPRGALIRVGIVPITLAFATDAPPPGAEGALLSATLDHTTLPPLLVLEVEGSRFEAPLELPICSETESGSCDPSEELSKVTVIREAGGFRAAVTAPSGEKADLLGEIEPTSPSIPGSRLVIWGGSIDSASVGLLDDVVLKIAPEWPCGFSVPQMPGGCEIASPFDQFGQTVSVARGKDSEFCALVTASHGNLNFEPGYASIPEPEALTSWRSSDGQAWTSLSSLDAPAVHLPEGSLLVGAGIAADNHGFLAAVAYREAPGGIVRVGLAAADDCEAWTELTPGPALFEDAEAPSYVVEARGHEVYFTRPPTDQTRRTLWRVGLDEPDRAPELLSELPSDVGQPVSVIKVTTNDLVLSYPSVTDTGVSEAGLLVSDARAREWQRVDPSRLLQLPRRPDVFNGQGRLAFDDLGIAAAALAFDAGGGFFLYAGKAPRGDAASSLMQPTLQVGTARFGTNGQTFPEAHTRARNSCGDGTCAAGEDCVECEADCPCGGIELLRDELGTGDGWQLFSADANPTAIRYFSQSPPGLNWSSGDATWSALPLERGIVGDFELSFDLWLSFAENGGCSGYVGLGTMPEAGDARSRAGVFAHFIRPLDQCFLERYITTPEVVAGNTRFGNAAETGACKSERSLVAENTYRLALRREGSEVTVVAPRIDGCGTLEQSVRYAGPLPPLSALLVGFGGDPFSGCSGARQRGTVSNLKLRLLDDPADCPNDQERCGSASEQASCVDVKESAEHCGACGDPCSANEWCRDGACHCAELPGILACEGVCVDPKTSLEHCGICGRACKSQCLDGLCDPISVGDCASPFEIPPEGGTLGLVFPDEARPGSYEVCEINVVNPLVGEWIPERDGLAVVEVQPTEQSLQSEPPLDTVLAVTPDPSCGQWLACNDDIVLGVEIGSHLEWPVVAGTSYRLMVGGWDYGTGAVGLAEMTVGFK
jgi:hypothetical protein